MAGYESCGPPRPPRVLPTVVVTVFFGLLGLIPAYRASQRAQRVGARPGRYWIAFGISLVACVVLYGVITVALVIGLLTALVADAILAGTALPLHG